MARTVAKRGRRGEAASKTKRTTRRTTRAPKPAKRTAKKPARKARSGRAKATPVERALARASVAGLLKRLPPPIAPIVKALRKIVLEAAPEATEQLEGSNPAYFAEGMFAQIEPREREVLVKFIRGAQLPSADAALSRDGEGGTLTLSTLAEVRASVLKTLVREAVMLNLSKSLVAPKPDAPMLPLPPGQSLA